MPVAFSFLFFFFSRGVCGHVLSQSNHEHFQKGLDFAGRPYYYVFYFQKLIESPTTIRQKEERDILRPWDNLGGGGGGAALQISFSSCDLVTAQAYPGAS